MADALRYRKWKVAGLCVNCGRKRDILGVRCARCKQHHGKVPDLRWKIIQHYGPFCKCCGETIHAFLTLDHANRDGAELRRKGLSGMTLLYWIIRNDYPNSIQVLCYNCNCGREKHGGTCPHKLVGSKLGK